MITFYKSISKGYNWIIGGAIICIFELEPIKISDNFPNIIEAIGIFAVYNGLTILQHENEKRDLKRASMYCVIAAILWLLSLLYHYMEGPENFIYGLTSVGLRGIFYILITCGIFNSSAKMIESSNRELSQWCIKISSMCAVSITVVCCISILQSAVGIIEGMLVAILVIIVKLYIVVRMIQLKKKYLEGIEKGEN